MRIFTLFTVSSTALAYEYTVPEPCISRCPLDLNDIGAACTAVNMENDLSQMDFCLKLCLPEREKIMADCYKCYTEADASLAHMLDYALGMVCVAEKAAMNSTTTEEAMVKVPSSSTGVKDVSNTGNPVPTNSTVPDSSATALFITPVAMVLGLVLSAVL